MESILRDLRFSLKLLLRDRAYSGTVLLTLGVCIATNVAIFSVVQTVVLSPLPFDDPDELVTMYNSYPGAGVERASNGVPDFFERRERVEAFESVGAYRSDGATIGGAGDTEPVSTLDVTPSFLPMLGVEAEMGRTFLEEEMEPGSERTVLLTYGYWQERMGGAADAVGGSLRLDGMPVTIVGVLPESFRMPGESDVRLVRPLRFPADARSLDNWHSNNLQMMGRLAPGRSVAQAEQEVAALNAALWSEWPLPGGDRLIEDTGFHTVVVSALDDLTRDVRPILFLLWGGAAFVLLIGCVNVANLTLARTESRAREIATRMSLGAQRARVARQVLTEAAVMGVIGGVVGVGLGALGLRLLSSYGIAELPRGAEVAIDGPVLLYTLALSLGATLLFGAIPVVHLFRSDLGSVFREEGRSGTSGRGAILLRNALVSGQVALAFLLLIGAGLMVRSLAAATDVDPGFDPAGVMTAYVALPEARYPDADARRAFADELLAELRALPGVADVGVTSQLPFGLTNASSVIFPEGYAPPPGESVLAPLSTVAGPGYFEALAVPLRQGRDFQASDGPDGPQVLVLDEWLATRFWPDGNALGQRMVVGAVPGSEDASSEENLFTVIGIVDAVKHGDLTRPDDSYVGAYYFTYRQRPLGYMAVAARSSGADAETLVEPIRATVTRLDAELPIFAAETMESRLHESLASLRTPMVVLLVFAGVALVLAVVGVYGLLAYAVERRTREIGIRVAVGSDPAAVFRLVLREGLVLTGMGLAVGGAGVLLLGRVLESMVFGVRPADPFVVTVTAGALAGAAALACAVPARRATRLDPGEALTAG